MSNKKQIELWYCYCVNYRQRLEDDIKQLQSNLRYRKVDAVDCMELALAIERLNCFNEYCRHTNEIFKILSGNELQNPSSD